jgi:hypothetical protein
MKYIRGIIYFVVSVSVIGLIIFLIWANTPLGPMPEALQALQSDSDVTVTTDGLLVFRPASVNSETGVIIYPGGRIDPRSYAPAAHALARQGYLAVIVPMPLNLAVLAPDRANSVIDAYPEIEFWAVGGHSLGGAMAADYILSSGSAEALFLWASYPSSNTDLSSEDVIVTSVYGSLDGLASPDEVLSAADLLPVDTIWVEITGGNHGQFGWYGDQPGDNPAAISREQQQSILVQATANVLQQLSR